MKSYVFFMVKKDKIHSLITLNLINYNLFRAKQKNKIDAMNSNPSTFDCRGSTLLEILLTSMFIYFKDTCRYFHIL